MSDLEKVNRKKRDSFFIKLVKLVFFALAIFVLSGASFLIIDKKLLPYLASIQSLKRFSFLRRVTENVVVVNKTEEVKIGEEQTIANYVAKASSSVVEILSVPESDDPKNKNLLNFKTGSGLMVTSDGLVLTNSEAILIKENINYKVLNHEGNVFDAQLFAQDDYSELVFLKINSSENYPVASFIDPNDIKVGTKVVVIGRGFPKAQAIYQFGILSVKDLAYSIKGSEVGSSEKMQGVYFLDRNLANPSLLGGAIVDYHGDVLGIVSQKDNGRNKDTFMIGVDYINRIVKEVIEKGSTKKPYLGLYYIPVTKELKTLYNLTREEGALVWAPNSQQGLAVVAGSPADKAGIKLYDIITEIDGFQVSLGSPLPKIISDHAVGDEAKFKIVRDGKEFDTMVTLE